MSFDGAHSVPVDLIKMAVYENDVEMFREICEVSASLKTNDY